MSQWRAIIGAVVWLTFVGWLHPSPFEPTWATLLLLLAPLVLVPLGLELISDSGSRLLAAAVQLQFPTALILVLAFHQPPVLLAASLGLPWLLTTALIASAGLARIRRQGWDGLCLNAGLVYLVVGGCWTVLALWGQRPLGFESIIVLLTGIHFHYAGFLLPILTELACRQAPGLSARVASTGVVAGVPLVAIGITATQLGMTPSIEFLAVCLTALGGLFSAWLHLRLATSPKFPWAARVLWFIAALSLAGSMVLAVLYGSRFYLAIAWLDIPWMRTLHGSANALGFGLAGAVGWAIALQRVEQ